MTTIARKRKDRTTLSSLWAELDHQSSAPESSQQSHNSDVASQRKRPRQDERPSNRPDDLADWIKKNHFNLNVEQLQENKDRYMGSIVLLVAMLLRAKVKWKDIKETLEDKYENQSTTNHKQSQSQSQSQSEEPDTYTQTGPSASQTPRRQRQQREPATPSSQDQPSPARSRGLQRQESLASGSPRPDASTETSGAVVRVANLKDANRQGVRAQPHDGSLKDGGVQRNDKTSEPRKKKLTFESLKERMNKKNSAGTRDEMREHWDKFTSINPNSNPSLAEEDFYQVGDLLFCRMFGGTVKERLYELLVECNNATSKDACERRERMKEFASKLRGQSEDELAEFVEAWGRVDGESVGLQAEAERLRLCAKKWEVWEQWQALKNLYQGNPEKATAMKALLAREDIQLKQGQGIDTGIQKYLARGLGLEGKSREFANIIYRYTIFGILVAKLGMGVLVFLPGDIEAWWRGFKGGKNETSVEKPLKKERVKTVLDLLIDRVPELSRICAAAEESIIQGFLKDGSIKVTKALSMVKEGRRKREVLGLPLIEYVS
ncbi:hypothetical protein CSIM01_13836 [Colletotrichum simmondsii]|uniref:Uncharacterized protein n=1 Tax=Colletotrichum simmondsii TaxID=703756 RepID=A0A135RQD3_9PEZI|nr:hypothetical protein CSIM01_13836 [Colletotrichum simmondsii]